MDKKICGAISLFMVILSLGSCTQVQGDDMAPATFGPTSTIPVYPTDTKTTTPVPPSVTPTQTPAPPTATLTITSSPTIHYLRLTPPSKENVQIRYNEVVRPITERLETAKQVNQIPRFKDLQVFLIPADERLFYIQTTLYPSWELDNAKAIHKLFIVYEYERGGPVSLGGIGPPRYEVGIMAQFIFEDVGGLGLAHFYGPDSPHGYSLGYGGLGLSFESFSQAAVKELELGKVIKRCQGCRDWEKEVRDALVGILDLAEVDTSTELSDRENIFLLSWALESPDWVLRHEAVGNLGFDLRGQSVPLLIKALDDPNDKVRALSLHYLEAITGKDFGEYANDWKIGLEELGTVFPTETPTPEP